MLEFRAFIKKTALLNKSIIALITSVSMLCGLVGGIFAVESPAQKQFKNVIFMIGDGMGENHLKKTEAEKNVDLWVEELAQHRGQSKTNSTSSPTDSAAGATALACGTRTTNGCIGVFPQDMLSVAFVPLSVTEYAMSKGMRTGIVTTDSNAGATPGGFSVHVHARSEAEEISRQQLASGIDIIWSAKSGCITEENAAAAGYNLVETETEFDTLTNGSKSFCQFEGDLWSPETAANSPCLSEMADKAIKVLDNDDNGFFLMVEGAHIDKKSHSNLDDEMETAVIEFDRAIKIAMDFAKADGETLVIVTADHETGGIKEINGNYSFTIGSHTAANVPLFVYGSDTFVNDGEAIKNKEVAKRTAMAMGCPETEFPKKVAM